MTSSEAINTLSRWDRTGRFVYTTNDLKKLLNDSTDAAFRKTLHRLVRQGVLERVARGVYMYAHSAHIGATTIEDIARTMRRGEFVFESLESALSQWGRISQIPIDRITLMTTGRRGEYRTPYGVIEFTHTTASRDEILANTITREGHTIPIASEAYAIKNLKRTRRNLSMITDDEEE
jgi:predicted transcriptional regulator of viral defense system